MMEEVKEEEVEEEEVEVGTTYPFKKSELPDSPDTAGMSDEEIESVKKHWAMVLELAKLWDDPSWDLKTKPTDKNSNLSVFFKPAETNESVLVCGEIEANIPIEKIDDVISDHEKWGMFDKVIDKVTVIKNLDANYKIVHWLNKGNFMMGPWDYVMTHAKNVLKTGEIVHTFYCT